MGKYLTILSIVIGVTAYGQTNTFPTNGNVGVGTINPDVNIHVWESSESRPGGIAAPTKSIFKLSRSGTSNYSYPESAEFRIGHGSSSIWGSQLDLYINGASNQTNIPDQQVMTWQYNGNVGIGTSSPAAKLMVNNGAMVLGVNSIVTNKDGHLSIGNTHENSIPTTNNWTDSTTFLLSAQNYSSIGFHQSGSRVDFIRVGGGTIQLGYDGGWGIANIGLPQGIWNAQGNVGIGTTNPQSKLAVNGIITSKEVNVTTTGWPDYVFDSSYELKPLTAVASYIQENKHLPNIPSAEEVSKNGIALGEMNKKLLEKVEELTLYVIKQNEESKQQKEQIKSQSEDVKQLKELLQKQSDLLSKQSEQLSKQQQEIETLKSRIK